MNQFPYITPYLNELFARERVQWDFVILRPLILVSYFFIRFIAFPFKFVFHRNPWGCEAKLIDWLMSIGIKYFARSDAAELILRHVQIEPLLYRHILQRQDSSDSLRSRPAGRKLNGIDGDFGIENLGVAIENNMTIGHDELSYEVVDRFDRDVFLNNLDFIRSTRPEDHTIFSKGVLDENRKHSFQWLGATNIVLLIVTTITIVADLKTTIQALNSFGSDSTLLWCMKHLYRGNDDAEIDLDFFMQESSNRGHYNSSAFFSNPSQYLYYHIVFDEVVYDWLRHRPPVRPSS